MAVGTTVTTGDINRSREPAITPAVTIMPQGDV
jgi:hypothetical protein